MKNSVGERREGDIMNRVGERRRKRKGLEREGDIKNRVEERRK